MMLLPPDLLNVGFREQRGLYYLADAYELRPDTIEVAIVGVSVSFGTELVPGEETEVTLTTQLPPNANVRSVKATVNAGASLKQPETSPMTVSVSQNGGEPDSFEVTATPMAGPSNVTVRLDQGDVFWSQSGPLASGSHELPDFAPQLNAYLDRLSAGEAVVLKFLVKSDTPGTVSFSMPLSDVDFRLIQTQAWPNPLDATLRVDRNLEAEFGTVERFPLDAFQGPAGLHLTSVRLDIGGRVGSERLFGPIPAYDGRELATVSGDYSVGQPLTPDTEIEVVGLTCRLLARDASELFAALYPDASGGPLLDKPLASGNLTFDAPEPVAMPEWRYVAFETAAKLTAGTTYWAVLKAARGIVLVAMQPGPHQMLGAARVNRGGSLWADLGGSALLICPVFLPGPDTRSAAVGVMLEGGGSAVRLDVGPDPALIELPPAGAGSPPAIVLQSYARGILSVANVVQEYEP
jgi:hypothetical protein